MTKKDYIQFADLFANESKYLSQEKKTGVHVFYDLYYGIVDILKADNSRFNQDKFAQYINKKSGYYPFATVRHEDNLHTTFKGHVIAK